MRNPKRIIGLALSLTVLFALFTIPNEDSAQSYKLPRNPKPLHPLPALTPQQIHIAVLNLFMRPRWLFRDGQIRRAQLLPPHLRGADVLILAEAFDARARSLLLRDLRSAYPHRSKLLGKDRWFQINGGVMVLSRWPISRQAQLLYQQCKGTDCLAQKGVVYAQIEKPGRRFHIFATHPQAHPNKQAQQVRKQQLEALARFVNQQRIPRHDPVLIGGDLNVDKLRNPHEYGHMLAQLNAVFPHKQQGAAYTFHPQRNQLAQGETPEYLDYVLWVKGHIPPTHSHITSVPLYSATPWRKQTRDLSDHTAIFAAFDYFPKATSSTIITVKPRIKPRVARSLLPP